MSQLLWTQTTQDRSCNRKLDVKETFPRQVTVTANGLQARYVDQSKLDLPTITASARYRFQFHVCNNLLSVVLVCWVRHEKYMQTHVKNFSKKTALKSLSFKSIGAELDLSARSYLNIAQYDEADSDEDSVTSNFTSLGLDKQLEQRRLWAEELAIVDGQIQGLEMELRQQARRALLLKRKLGLTAWREFSDDMKEGWSRKV